MTDFFSYLFHIQIDFVSNDYKWEVVRVTWTCLYKELIAPAVKGAECSCLRHVVHQDAAVSTAVERNSKTLEPLLARCVPYLAHTVPDYASTTNGSCHVISLHHCHFSRLHHAIQCLLSHTIIIILYSTLNKLTAVKSDREEV